MQDDIQQLQHLMHPEKPSIGDAWLAEWFKSLTGCVVHLIENVICLYVNSFSFMLLHASVCYPAPRCQPLLEQRGWNTVGKALKAEDCQEGL